MSECRLCGTVHLFGIAICMLLSLVLTLPPAGVIRVDSTRAHEVASEVAMNLGGLAFIRRVSLSLVLVLDHELRSEPGQRPLG